MTSSLKSENYVPKKFEKPESRNSAKIERTNAPTLTNLDSLKLTSTPNEGLKKEDSLSVALKRKRLRLKSNGTNLRVQKDEDRMSLNKNGL